MHTYMVGMKNFKVRGGQKIGLFPMIIGRLHSVKVLLMNNNTNFSSDLEIIKCLYFFNNLLSGLKVENPIIMSFSKKCQLLVLVQQTRFFR